MRVLGSVVLMLILCASCTRRKTEVVHEPEAPTPTPVVQLKAEVGVDSKKAHEKESQKILQWFEQMDVIYREALWVIRQEKAPQGKSLFGKMQRALLVDMKQKLSNKSLFKCDVYSMTRNFSGAGVVPQQAEVLHQCNTKESFIKIGDWTHSKPDELTINFRGGNLSEVLGFATGVLSPQISCKLKSAENGAIESFRCEGLMIDYNPAKNQVLRFNQFEYKKNSKDMLSIKAEVLEDLDPVRKIEVEIPLEGKITLTETVLQEPVFIARQVPVASPTPKPTLSPAPSPTPYENQDPISAEDKYHDQNGQEIDRQEDPQTRGVREETSPTPQQQNPENQEEGVIESNDPQPESPRENNTR